MFHPPGFPADSGSGPSTPAPAHIAASAGPGELGPDLKACPAQTPDRGDRKKRDCCTIDGMGARYRRYGPDQVMLLLPSLRDRLPDDDLAYLSADAIDALDLRALHVRGKADRDSGSFRCERCRTSEANGVRGAGLEPAADGPDGAAGNGWPTHQNRLSVPRTARSGNHRLHPRGRKRPHPIRPVDLGPRRESDLCRQRVPQRQKLECRPGRGLSGTRPAHRLDGRDHTVARQRQPVRLAVALRTDHLHLAGVWAAVSQARGNNHSSTEPMSWRTMGRSAWKENVGGRPRSNDEHRVGEELHRGGAWKPVSVGLAPSTILVKRLLVRIGRPIR